MSDTIQRVEVRFPGPQGRSGRGFNPRGDWQPDTEYAIDDTVTYLGDLYRATAAHTSPHTFDGINLNLIVARGEQGEQGTSTGIAVFSAPSSGSTEVPTPSQPSVTLIPGNRIFGIGDSITATGDNNVVGNVQTGGTNPSINALNWQAWACLFSGGTMQYAGMSAMGGYEASQVKSIHLPRAISAAPSACTVLAGRNDVGHGVAYSTTISNLSSIYAQLKAAGIIPILCTPTPINDRPDSQMLLTMKLCAWIRRQAAQNQWPLVDFFAVCANPNTGQYKSGYTSDGVHPTVPAVRLMGAALYQAIQPWLAPYKTSLAVAQFASGQDVNWIINALNLLDSDADGIPNTWSAMTGTGYTSSITDGSVDGVAGKWWEINRTSGTNTVTFLGPTSSVTSGQKLAVGFAMLTSGIEAGGASVDVALVSTANTSQVICGLSGWSGDLTAAGKFYSECIASVTGSVRLRVSINNGTGLLKLGQLTAINLSSNGIA